MLQSMFVIVIILCNLVSWKSTAYYCELLYRVINNSLTHFTKSVHLNGIKDLTSLVSKGGHTPYVWCMKIKNSFHLQIACYSLFCYSCVRFCEKCYTVM